MAVYHHQLVAYYQVLVAIVAVEDVGNLYRFLRALEEDGIVESEWDGDLPGPARRTYQLTETGRTLLRRWADALRQAQTEIAQFLERHDEQRR